MQYNVITNPIWQTAAILKIVFWLLSPFDRVPREVTRWALRKAGVDERFVKAVMKVMYECAHYLLLFVIVMEMISRELRARLPLELLYADDLISMADSEESPRDKIVKWKSG